MLDGGPHPSWQGEGDSMQPLPNYFGHLFILFVIFSIGLYCVLGNCNM